LKKKYLKALKGLKESKKWSKISSFYLEIHCKHIDCIFDVIDDVHGSVRDFIIL